VYKRPRTSRLWEISKEELQNLLNTSNSIVEILKKLDFPAYSGNHVTLSSRIKEDGLDKTQFLINAKNHRKNFCRRSKISHDDFFKLGKDTGSSTVRKRIIKNNLLDYKCLECGNTGTHNDKILTLQIDHINGISNDNRLENLRFLCPNCHSQTETYAGKRLKKEKVYETEKEKLQRIEKTRKLKATKEELIELLQNNSVEAVGRHFRVNGNTVRKRCENLGIDYKKIRNMR